MKDPKSTGAALRPRVGVVALAFPGYYLGEEKAPEKLGEALRRLEGPSLELAAVPEVVTDAGAAREAGLSLAARGVSSLCAILTTFVPDHFLVALLGGCDVPLFLWAVEREIGCISLVGAMLANPTLYELGKKYRLHAGDLDDGGIRAELEAFARAAEMKRALSLMRVGSMGANPDIMFSMAADEYGLMEVFGVTVIPLRDFEYPARSGRVPAAEASADWTAVQRQVGRVEVSDADGVEASRAFLSMAVLARERKLDALSINCWTHLKSRVCLPVARLNEAGIGAGCEGDLHSTILMRLLFLLAGRAPINGDFMRLFPEKNQIMFSHCGAGSFSMARSPAHITLHASEETRDGIGVFFPADQPGTATAVNLMGSRAGYRLTLLCGEVETTDMVYEGNPMRIRFRTPVADILRGVVEAGAGHHWSISYGDWSREFEEMCRFLGVPLRVFR
jgi:L-fucose isomerase-like protein